MGLWFGAALSCDGACGSDLGGMGFIQMRQGRTERGMKSESDSYSSFRKQVSHPCNSVGSGVISLLFLAWPCSLLGGLYAGGSRKHCTVRVRQSKPRKNSSSAPG